MGGVGGVEAGGGGRRFDPTAARSLLEGYASLGIGLNIIVLSDKQISGGLCAYTVVYDIEMPTCKSRSGFIKHFSVGPPHCLYQKLFIIK